MDIKILINNPVLSHTSRRVGCVSPMKSLSNNQRYKQVRGISLRSLHNTQYSFPLTSPELYKHSVSQKKLMHQKREVQTRHKKTMTVPNFIQQSVENSIREEFGSVRSKNSIAKKAFAYLNSQANFLKTLLQKKSLATTRISPKRDSKAFDYTRNSEHKKVELEVKKLKENDFRKHKKKVKSNRNVLTLAEKIEQLAFNLIVN